jgi:hypothetical protein
MADSGCASLCSVVPTYPLRQMVAAAQAGTCTCTLYSETIDEDGGIGDGGPSLDCAGQPIDAAPPWTSDCLSQGGCQGLPIFKDIVFGYDGGNCQAASLAYLGPQFAYEAAMEFEPDWNGSCSIVIDLDAGPSVACTTQSNACPDLGNNGIIGPIG